jgi:hypothetical protein
MIHGAYDATGYIGVATSSELGAQLREVMIFIGLIIAILVFSRKKRRRQLFLSAYGISDGSSVPKE